jgi:hypothetical protein
VFHVVQIDFCGEKVVAGHHILPDVMVNGADCWLLDHCPFHREPPSFSRDHDLRQLPVCPRISLLGNVAPNLRPTIHDAAIVDDLGVPRACRVQSVRL